MPFDRHYTSLYDHFYADKDYDAECDLLEQVFGAAADPPSTVLDLGCGTGAHALRLARRGYAVTGLDRSRHMLARARDKAREAGLEVIFEQGDLVDFELGRRFDAVICMFAVLGYVTSDPGLAAALIRVRQHLEPGGVFVFDSWYGPAVLEQRPEVRARSFDLDDGSRVQRLVEPELDESHHVVRVTYRLVHTVDERVVEESSETHDMRYFFADEVEELLARAGFHEVALAPFGAPGQELTARHWNMMVVAR